MVSQFTAVRLCNRNVVVAKEEITLPRISTLQLFASAVLFYCTSEAVHVWRYFIVLKRDYYKRFIFYFFKIILILSNTLILYLHEN